MAEPVADKEIADKGIVKRASRHSVDETLAKLQSLLKAKEVSVFALIDHSGEAEKVGLFMHPTKLLIFGNPKGGTPMMVATPSLALDLPLKMLIAEDDQGVWVSYNRADYLAERHGLPAELRQPLALVESLAIAITA